ncbi:MAG: PASTA domain-containing protein [Bacteroidetes bacterium]|nr:PASTA domain-containing protein [Bacteroidota bacterium]
MFKNIFTFLKSRTFLINIGIAIVALPLVIWCIFLWLASYTHHNDTITVPDFRNLKIRQLDDFVADKNISYEIIDSIYDPKQEKGTVIKQDPDPGDKVKQGRKIYLYVTSSQPPKIAMPDLDGTKSNKPMSDRQAVRVCESYGLRTSITMVDDERQDLVVSMLYDKKHIAPGTMIEKGSLITLNVGKGSANSSSGFAVPQLVGMTFRAARGKMTDLGVEWVLIPDPGVKDTLNAIIYNQDPPAGRDKRMLQGSTIDLRVSGDKLQISSGDTTKVKRP